MSTTTTTNKGFFVSLRSTGIAVATTVEVVANTATTTIQDAGEVVQDLTASAKNASRILRVKSGDALDETIVESNRKADALVASGVEIKSEYQKYFDRDEARSGIWATR